MYILTEQLEGDARAAFARYRRYLNQVWERLPPGVREFIKGDWYFDSGDHRCPHDAWLGEVRIFEPYSGARREKRNTSIKVRLLGAYHDGHIELNYHGVSRYSFTMQNAARGHCDWRHDEIRLAADGDVAHEIEWWDAKETGRWLIQAEDIEYRWIPLPGGGRPD